MASGDRPNGAGASGWLLSIDFGTTATAAVTVTGGQVSLLALDGAGRMSSSVYSAPPEAVLKVGRQADHEAGYALDRFEPTPKRKIGKPVVRLGGTSYTPAELIAAIFRHVLTEAVSQHNKAAPARVVLTHPVRWPPAQVAVLAAAAQSAARESGVVLPDPEFVPEPVAAAQWYARDDHHEPLHPGQRIAIYDLGGGTFDTTVLERTGVGYEVLAKGGIDPLGGYDFDYRLFTYLGDRHIGPANPVLWEALQIPNPDDVDVGWSRRHMQDSVQLLKEQLSDRTSDSTHLPGVSEPVLMTRSEFEGLIDADVERTIDELTDTLAEAGLTSGDLTAIYRIGGASRTTLVGQRLEALHVPVRTFDDAKLVVALGASVTARTEPPKKATRPAQGTAASTEDSSQSETAVHTFAKLHDSGTASSDTVATQTADPATHDAPTTKPTAEHTSSSDDKQTRGPSKQRDDAMGRWAWAAVVTGSVLITVAMVICLVPWRGDHGPMRLVWVVSVAVAVVGALQVRIGVGADRRSRRGWLLSGIVCISAATALALFRLLWLRGVIDSESPRDTGQLVVAAAVLATAGVLFILVPLRRQAQRHAAIISSITAGTSLVATAVFLATVPPTSVVIGDEPDFGDCRDPWWNRHYDCNLTTFDGWQGKDRDHAGSFGVYDNVFLLLAIAGLAGVALVFIGWSALRRRSRFASTDGATGSKPSPSNRKTRTPSA